MAFLQQVFPVMFASATTTVSVTASIEVPGAWVYAFIHIPTMTSGYGAASTPIWLQGSPDNVTFVRITNPEATNNTLVAGINDYTVASSVSQRLVPLPLSLPRYLRLEISGVCTNPTAQTSTNPFRFIVVPNQ